MKLTDKVKALPVTPGVYLFKAKNGEVIYVGKASRLRSRVGQYFAFPIRDTRPKVVDMMREAAALSTIDTESEMEALFLESELIKRYQPKYNAEWRDEKNFNYVRINYLFSYPPVELVRRPLPDKATYIGPFIDAMSLKRSLRYLRKIFPYSIHKNNIPARGPVTAGSKFFSPRPMNIGTLGRKEISAPAAPPLATHSLSACFDFHIGLCPGPEIGAITPAEYKKSLKKLEQVIKGKRTNIIKDLESEMKVAARSKEFEKASVLRDKALALRGLSKRKIFGGEEKFDVMSDEALIELSRKLDLPGIPKRIEAFDISNFAGHEAVASMIVFENGIPRKDQYKRFKIRHVRGIDDFAMMREVILRRFSKRSGKWPDPDLVVIDGGKGQLSSALSAMAQQRAAMPAIGLAKREEEIFKLERHELLKTNTFKLIKLAHTNPGLKLLQRVRDEAHRFAVTYHSTLRSKIANRSFLDSIAGIGPQTKRDLLLHFKSPGLILEAEFDELAVVVGKSKASLIKKYKESSAKR